jgi:CDP-paratose 2-epimerase
VARVLITGGAGFVGANLAVALAERHADWDLVALDNLHRAGSELNTGRLEAAGVEFVRADVRDRGRLLELDRIDALVECSAEPSALAGVAGDGSYAFETNVAGAYNCLELARRDGAQIVFLSSSRVYPHRALNALVLEDASTRFELAAEQPLPGASAAGIAEDFPLGGARTLYGATKLAAELLVTEYAESFGLATVVNRCGVIAGPWQMGTSEQGVFAHWALHHHFGLPLTYIGFGGRQVRDLLHVNDLVALVDEQLGDPAGWEGFVGNVGGGREVSLSLIEATEICRELTGNEPAIGTSDDIRAGDVPLYISDCSQLFERTDWRPRASARDVLADTVAWVAGHSDELAETLSLGRVVNNPDP